MMSMTHQLCLAAGEGTTGLSGFQGAKGMMNPLRETQQIAQRQSPNRFSCPCQESFSRGGRMPVLGQTVHNKVSVAHIHRSWGLQHEEHFIPFTLIFSICSLLPARYSHVGSSSSLPFPSLFQKLCQARAFYH